MRPASTLLIRCQSLLFTPTEMSRTVNASPASSLSTASHVATSHSTPPPSHPAVPMRLHLRNPQATQGLGATRHLPRSRPTHGVSSTCRQWLLATTSVFRQHPSHPYSYFRTSILQVSGASFVSVTTCDDDSSAPAAICPTSCGTTLRNVI
jgi:hypothetical protein